LGYLLGNKKVGCPVWVLGLTLGGQGGASAAPLQVRSVVKLRQQFVYTLPRLPYPKSRVSINMTE